MSEDRDADRVPNDADHGQTRRAARQDREVEMIAGLATEAELHPMQQPFIHHDALQCGYRIPGQIMAAISCLREGHANSHKVIRKYMSGNLSRSGAYEKIVLPA